MIVSCSWHVLHRQWPLTSMRPGILSDLQFINPPKQKPPGPYFNLMTSVRVFVCTHFLNHSSEIHFCSAPSHQGAPHHQTHPRKSWPNEKEIIIWQPVTVLACLSSQQPAANPHQGRRGLRSLRACSQLFVFILNETASEEFACLHDVPCCAPLTALTACASEGKAHPRLGKASVTVRCTGSAFGKGGGLFAERGGQSSGGWWRGKQGRRAVFCPWIFH